MISKKVIDQLYKQYNRRPSSIDELNIPLLFESVHPGHGIEFDEGELVINSVPLDSPFHRIPLALIHEIVEFDDEVAIVLHSSIIFLSRRADSQHPVQVHLKPLTPSLTNRLGSIFRKTSTNCAML